MRVVKQYGEMRTCTNVVRHSLNNNFEDILILMHVLGDKHSPQAPFKEIWKEIVKGSLPKTDFVLKATKSCPAESTCFDDQKQIEYMQKWGNIITDAYDNCAIHILVSIKNPISWLSSMHKYETRMLCREPTSIKALINRYASCYKSWLELRDIDNFNFIIVKYEDLMFDYDLSIRKIAARLDIKVMHNNTFQPPCERLNPTYWDYSKISTSRGDRYNESCHCKQSCGYEISSKDREIILSGLDWGVMAEYGYLKDFVI